jgi:hypothetical protein
MKLQMKLMVIVTSRITSTLKGWYGRVEKYGIDCLETPHICLGPGNPNRGSHPNPELKRDASPCSLVRSHKASTYQVLSRENSWS